MFWHWVLSTLPSSSLYSRRPFQSNSNLRFLYFSGASLGSTQKEYPGPAEARLSPRGQGKSFGRSPCVHSFEEPDRLWVEFHKGQWKLLTSKQPQLFHIVCLKLCSLVGLSTEFAIYSETVLSLTVWTSHIDVRAEHREVNMWLFFYVKIWLPARRFLKSICDSHRDVFWSQYVTPIETFFEVNMWLTPRSQNVTSALFHSFTAHGYL